MANIGRWETVVSKSRKVAPSIPKKKAMQALENMPKIEDLVSLQPMKESETMFGAFNGAKHNKNKGQGNEGSKSSLRPGQENLVAKKNIKDKVIQQKSLKPKTLVAAMKTLSHESLEKALNQSKRAFPSATLLWLKDMASFLNVHFEEVPLEDPVHSNERADYPACELPSLVKQVVVKTMQGSTNNVLEMFFYHCVQSMTADLSKGLSIYGYQIVVQLLGFMSPTNVLGDLTKYSELLAENQGRPLRCLAILWAIGQCGQKDLNTGLRVFFDIMHPLVSTRQLAPFILGNLDLILKLNGKHLNQGSKSLGLQGYFTVLDFFNQSKPTSLTSVEMNQLSKSILPKLKILAYGKDLSKMHQFFPSYLSRINSTGPLRSEYLSSLVQCLTEDSKSFSIWRELYIKQLPASGMLLKHLVDCQESRAVEGIDKGLLKDTVKSFVITNEEMRAAYKQEPAGLHICEENCEALLAKTVSALEAASPVGKSKRVVGRLLMLMGLTVLLDLLVAKGHSEHCLTNKLIQSAGLAPFSDMMILKFQNLSEEINHWVLVDLPIIYGNAVDYTAPYSSILKSYWFLCLKTLIDVYAWVLNHAIIIWTWLMATMANELPGLKESLESKLEVYWDATLLLSHNILDFFTFHGMYLMERLAAYGTDIKVAMESNDAALGISKWIFSFLDWFLGILAVQWNSLKDLLSGMMDVSLVNEH